jgi:hypothetical protein
MSAKEFTPNPYLPEFLQRIEAQQAEEAVALSRRSFIKITGLAGGGLVLAMSIGPGAKTAQAQAQARAGTTFAANPYVQIRADGTVVLFAKNPEVGQRSGRLHEFAASRSKLARRLRATQQQQADDRKLRRIELEVAEARIAKTLNVFFRAALEVFLDANQVLRFEVANRMLHNSLR